MKIPRMVLAGTESGVGKTTLSTGLMAAFREAGYRVQPYKVGPDYIDPSYHAIATGRKARNLDTWMVGEDRVRWLFARNCQGADLAVIEGVMGLFDGYDGKSEAGSTAAVAKLLQAPVILVINARGMARSAGAIAYGYKNFDPNLHVAGVILNNIGSERHLGWVRAAIEEEVGLPVAGYLPRDMDLHLPSRHLGLVPAGEKRAVEDFMAKLANQVKETVDLDKLMVLARKAPELQVPDFPPFTAGSKLRVAVARDEAFSFYYEDNLELLEELGAELITFSPLGDTQLPEGISGLYLGGGFPEVFAAELSANLSMRESIKQAVNLGMPVYAECGGFMYLTEAIQDQEGKTYPMVGAIQGKTEMEGRLVAMGYRLAECVGDNLLASAGEVLRGHEFHYSHFRPGGELPPAFISRRRDSRQGELAGVARGNLLASYLHIHFYSNPAVGEKFLSCCRAYRQGGGQ